jgi:hypothetical protein
MVTASFKSTFTLSSKYPKIDCILEFMRRIVIFSLHRILLYYESKEDEIGRIWRKCARSEMHIKFLSKKLGKLGDFLLFFR